MEATKGARLSVSRAIVARNHEVGIHVDGQDTEAQLEDVVVRDTDANAGGDYGRGLQVQYGARVTVDRGLFERNREISVFACAMSARLLMSDIVIRDTLMSACEACGSAGIGIGAYGGAHVDLSRFVVTNNPFCGVQLAFGSTSEAAPWPESGEMDLNNGEISFNTLCGANVQAYDFDINRLVERVIYRENGRNLDMQELPVPELGLEE